MLKRRRLKPTGHGSSNAASAECARLQSLGVDTAQMRTVSYGESMPAVVGSDETAYRHNRRAAFVPRD